MWERTQLGKAWKYYKAVSERLRWDLLRGCNDCFDERVYRYDYTLRLLTKDARMDVWRVFQWFVDWCVEVKYRRDFI